MTDHRPLSKKDVDKLMSDQEERKKVDSRRRERDERLSSIKSSESIVVKFLRNFGVSA